MKTIGTIKTNRHGSLAVRGAGRSFSLAVIVGYAGAAMSWIETRLERQRSRRLLGGMSDDQLKDIGLSRADAYRETHRSFWD